MGQSEEATGHRPEQRGKKLGVEDIPLNKIKGGQRPKSPQTNSWGQRRDAASDRSKGQPIKRKTAQGKVKRNGRQDVNGTPVCGEVRCDNSEKYLKMENTWNSKQNVTEGISELLGSRVVPGKAALSFYCIPGCPNPLLLRFTVSKRFYEEAARRGGHLYQECCLAFRDAVVSPIAIKALPTHDGKAVEDHKADNSQVLVEMNPDTPETIEMASDLLPAVCKDEETAGDVGNQLVLEKEATADALDLLNSTDLIILEQRVNKNEKFGYNDLVIAPSRIHGMGIFTKVDIPKETFLMEYEGEIIGKLVSDKRELLYLKNNIQSVYMFKVEDDMIIDATLQGNKARYINHSCEPNCYSTTVMRSKTVHYFTLRDVKAGEELSIDYHFSEKDPGEICLCGALNCRSSMGG